MPVTRSEPPAGAADAVRAALQQFAGVPRDRLNALAGTSPDELAPTVPHPVFNMGLDQLTATRSAPPAGALAASTPSGWRYLLSQSDEVVASAETFTDAAGSSQVASFNQGPFVAATAAALEVAEALPETKDGSYELRLLHVPALYTMAVWLHGDGDNDIFIPLDPSPDIEPNRPYPAAEFFGIMTEKAAQIPQMDPDDTRGG